MGQKVNPYGFRLGVTTDWKSRWFADRRSTRDYLIEDWKIRDYLMTQLPHARDQPGRGRAHARPPARRRPHRPSRHRHRSPRRRGRPPARRADARSPATPKVQLNIQEIKQPELDAALIAQGVADQLAGRVAFRRAMKRAVQTAQKAGALGIRCSARVASAAPR